MEKIRWCFSIKKGIRIAKPNEELSGVYLLKSESAIRAAVSLKGNREWEIAAIYYAMYFAAYAVLIKIGIKSVNHSCTIEFIKQFLQEYFSVEDVKLLTNAMASRIEAQYYTLNNQYLYNTQTALDFHAKCRGILSNLSLNEVNNIRGKAQTGG